jgi:hypothetical protein
VGVSETLRIFQEMEREATPQEKLNWRFQLALYRAYYDAYTRRRLIYETELEEKAMDVLRAAERVGAEQALNRAEAILDRAHAEPVAGDLRARTFELAEALFQSIRMQLSVKRYQAASTRRGANLDLIDVPLNDSVRLRRAFRSIRALSKEKKRVSAIEALTRGRYRAKLERDREVIQQGIQSIFPVTQRNRTVTKLGGGFLPLPRVRRGSSCPRLGRSRMGRNRMGRGPDSCKALSRLGIQTR